MRFSKAALPLVVFALTASACARNEPAQPEPRRLEFTRVADSLLHNVLREAHWGVEVWDQSRNQLLWAHNFDKHFVPASNTKIVVTTVAMGLLGPDWRYQTPLDVLGAPGDTAPRGLIVRGSGDPTMSGRYFGSDLAVIDSLADSLAFHGVKRINGDVIIDASRFTTERIHPSWETGDLPWYYAAPTAAFGVGEAAVRMVVTAADVKFPGGYAPAPVRSSVTRDTAGARASIDVEFQAWPDTLVVTGSIAPDRADSSWIAQPLPEQYAAQALVLALQKRQIEVTGRVRVIYDAAEVRALPPARTLLTWQSPPMSEIVAGILKPSQNWIAEQLVKTLGYTRGGGATWREGINVERRYLIDVVKVDSTAFSLVDASGLSAQNLLSPHTVVQLLEHARTQSWGPKYHAALPAPGMRGATLSSRLAGLETRVAAKTGTIANVNSLSGYMTTADGRNVTFSILTMASGRPSSVMRRGIDVLVQAIANSRNWDQ